MNTPVRLGAFAGALALAFGAAFGVGAAADPLTTERPAGHGGHAAEPADEPADVSLPGLAVSHDGYTLVPASAALPAGPRVPFRFTVTGPDGNPVTSYRSTHTKELHLIVVRRDLHGFQHVHPTRSADGRWSVPLDVAAGGTYRVFADFQPAVEERAMTLGTDIAVPGDFRPVALPAVDATFRSGEYDVALQASPVAGRESELTFAVSKAGADVADLQPYLGAFGHLVSLRTGDLAYLHTHPAQEAHPGDRGGPRVQFMTTFPTAGSYRLFLDFRIGGEVHTAEFTVAVPEAAAAGSVPSTGSARGDHS